MHSRSKRRYQRDYHILPLDYDNPYVDVNQERHESDRQSKRLKHESKHSKSKGHDRHEKTTRDKHEKTTRDRHEKPTRDRRRGYSRKRDRSHSYSTSRSRSFSPQEPLILQLRTKISQLETELARTKHASQYKDTTNDTRVRKLSSKPELTKLTKTEPPKRPITETITSQKPKVDTPTNLPDKKLKGLTAFDLFKPKAPALLNLSALAYTCRTAWLWQAGHWSFPDIYRTSSFTTAALIESHVIPFLTTTLKTQLNTFVETGKDGSKHLNMHIKDNQGKILATSWTMSKGIIALSITNSHTGDLSNFDLIRAPAPSVFNVLLDYSTKDLQKKEAEVKTLMSFIKERYTALADSTSQFKKIFSYVPMWWESLLLNINNNREARVRKPTADFSTAFASFSETPTTTSYSGTSTATASTSSEETESAEVETTEQAET